MMPRPAARPHCPLATYWPHCGFSSQSQSLLPLPSRLSCWDEPPLLRLAMGACATKPGDLKVKGEAPLVAEDAAAAPVASEEKAKGADGVVPAADTADAGRRRSLSDLLKQDAETIDREADQEAAEKVVAVEPATGAAGDAGAATGDGEADQEAAEKAVAVEPATGAAGDAGAATGDGEADQEAAEKVVAVEPATGAAGDAGAAAMGGQAPVQASAATEQDDPHGDVQAVVEEEKRVDPDSVQVVVPAAAAAAPSAEEGKVADDASA
ncbi:hypothetical protein PVAP13_1NG296200 [Panicum virgatum]|uniref:Uncharacterized protein n=2 Tax=Panicum virgatum TaxID=38727 RepID=A0A8T0WVW7_PANVG|nr:hypothetical protein PVAP13_1NG296200 [Panicum virgatum]